MPDLVIRPDPEQWSRDAARGATGTLLGCSIGEWRERTRGELGLPTDRPIIATGHQTLLWHPGILAKYMAVTAATRATGAAPANLIVDQHAGGFGAFPIPVALQGGGLSERLVHLATERPGVPMGLQAAFSPALPPSQWTGALPSVDRGVRQIIDAIEAHRDAPDAARQMGLALADLMAPWVDPMPNVLASELIDTCMGRSVLAAMVEDPWRSAAAYNAAVADRPEIGIPPLLVRDDYVEVPLWRIREDGRRMRAYDNDVERWLEDPAAAPRLMPRALMLTALVRLAMCDLFVHGTGGAAYDTVMEAWIEAWLGVTPAPIGVVSATRRLPLEPVATSSTGADVGTAGRAWRRAWHDPEGGAEHPGPRKRDLLARIARHARGSAERRQAFFDLHERLGELRDAHRPTLDALRDDASNAARRAGEQAVIDRRTWPFPLYPRASIDGLAREVGDAFARVDEPLA